MASCLEAGRGELLGVEVVVYETGGPPPSSSIERSSPGLPITSPRAVERLTLTGVLVGQMLSRTGTESAAPDVKAETLRSAVGLQTWRRIAGGGDV